MAEARALTRKQRAEHTKRMLFKKGGEILRDVRDPDDFVVESITEACGVSKGTFYLYFKSKGAFYYNVKLAEAQEARQALATSLKSCDGSARSDILEFVRKWLYYIDQYDLSLGQSWLSHISNEDSLDAADEEGMSVKNYIDLMARRIEAGVRRGEFLNNTPADRLATSVMVVLHGFSTLSVVTRKALDFDEWQEDAARIVDDGVLRRWLA